jgi:hypothetical protein
MLCDVEHLAAIAFGVKTAKTLGVEVPLSLLIRADELIE